MIAEDSGPEVGLIMTSIQEGYLDFSFDHPIYMNRSI
jgi:hypothetical protein